MKELELLQKMRGAPRSTQGLQDDVLRKFLTSDPDLGRAIQNAYTAREQLKKEYGDLLNLPEKDLIETLQKSYVNFYPTDQRNPYIPVGAAGPWIVTSHGAVLHDSGGYGMLGFGHAPTRVLEAMSQPHVMANVMTPNFSQKRFLDRLLKELGKRRKSPPFSNFICMNSGSEAMTVAARISDINAKKLTDPGSPHAGKRILFLALKGAFHGRTDRPAQASSSTKPTYDKHLATFRDRENLRTLTPNDVAELEEQFAWAAKEGVFFECMFMEPVMGEGDPGKAITPEFYAKARELTKKMGSLLIMDSIQASIRAHGCLSIMDYPGFEDLDPPEIESYSKALNAGQYPLSVLALTPKAADLYVRGVYGNTMTTNPRALDVASAVLDMLTPEVSRNIQERGQEFLKKFEMLKKEFPEVVTKVQGTGLLCSIDINPDVFQVVGIGQLEEYLRLAGIGVIHGGKNALRFTPHFRITSAEIDLIVDHLRDAFRNGPRRS